MGRKMYGVLILVIFTVCLSGSAIWGSKQSEYGTEDKIEEFQWFSDISYWNPPQWSQEENTVTGQISQKTGVSFHYMIPQKNADIQLSQMLVKDELPDVISIVDTTREKQLVESGKVWNIQDLLEQYDPDSPLLKQFPEDVKKLLEDLEGGWYCYPSHISSSDMRELYPPCDPYYWDLIYCINNEGIMFNCAIMERLGLTVEELRTEDQVLDAFRRVKQLGEQSGEELVPLLLNGKKYQGSSMPALSKSFGAKWIDENGDYQDYYFTDQAREAMHFLNTAYRDGCLEPRQFAYEVEEMQRELQSGNVFCFIGNLADIGADERKWEGGVILSSLGDNPAVQVTAQAQVWLHTYISKNCQNPEKIAKWLSFMASEEGLTLNFFGMEGRDYTIEDGLPQRTEAGLKGLNGIDNGFWMFWPFANSDWEKKTERPPEADSRQAAAYRVKTAMGKYKDSELYEMTLVTNLTSDLGETGGYGEQVNNIKEFKEKQLLTVITANSPKQFETEYQKLIQGLVAQGQKELDEVLNLYYQKRCQRYGITLEDNYREIEQGM